jgi:hypothetical protein
MALKRELLRLNYLALVAAGVLFVSTLFAWWGLDVFGPSFGISYSFRWSMWGGPLIPLAPSQPYYWVNNLNQVLSSGTSVIGTLGWVTAALTLKGMNTRRTHSLAAGLVLSVLILLLYVAVANAAVVAGHDAWSVDCISGPFGTCDDGLGTSYSIRETWGFQTGFFIYMAGTAAAFCALIYDRWFLQKAIDRAEVEEFERSLHLPPRQVTK